ncbi:MAG: hypothetical protein FWE35_16945 [Streptosporangiales bacterium]|nr:hypothetical protein [Streptosporangiales bacterium]
MMDFISRVAGEEAIVTIYRDRIEWVGAGVSIPPSLRLGASMIPFRLIHGVTARGLGFGRTALRVAVLGDIVEFRMLTRQAEEARGLLLRLESGLGQSAV